MPDDNETSLTRRHSLADHSGGVDHVHSHDGYDEVDHDHDPAERDGAPEANPDHVTLTSVGIDIGSAGTQVVFSRLNLQRQGESSSGRYSVVERETLFQSPVALTPYQSEERIDDAALGVIVDGAYQAAGLHPDTVDTGVVILTGEALRRENAQAIAGLLAERGGEFVCATAGHHMEATLAAYGSGAARVSRIQDKRILNIDIGGGTTKFAVVEKGRVIATAAVHIGGRLHVVDANQQIVRLDPAGKHLAERAGYAWKRGDRVDSAAMDKVAESMADALVAALIARPLPLLAKHLYLTEPIRDFGRLDGIMFSGGVGEYVYQREERDFGDMGKRLGHAVRHRIDSGALPWLLLAGGQCMRATALGASEFSVQLSGNANYISNPRDLLPRQNLQVLQPPFVCMEVIDPVQLATAIRTHHTAFDRVEGEGEVVLALRWTGAPTRERLLAFAQGISRGLANTIARRMPLFIMLDGAIARPLGAILRDEMGIANEVLILDGVTVWDFDYIDLGRLRWPSQTVPVTVKSLVFNEDPRGPHGHPHRHHHHNHDHDHGHSHSHDHAGGAVPARKSVLKDIATWLAAVKRKRKRGAGGR